MITLKGFDDVALSGHIEIPNIGELMHIPFIYLGDFEESLKTDNPYLREMLEKVPLKNDRKYVTVRTTLQYLTPNCITVPRGSWHYDTKSFEPDQTCRTHLLLSDCSAMTEFSKNPFQLSQFHSMQDHSEIERYMNRYADELFQETVVAPSNRFISWDGIQPHRCTEPKQREFRFMLRVIESDFVPPQENCNSRTSFVFVDNHDKSNLSYDYVQNKQMDNRLNIEKLYKPGTQEAGRIVIHIT